MAETKSNRALDRDVLHRYLWRHADHTGVVRVHTVELAALIQVRDDTIQRTLKLMVAEGRVSKHAYAERGVGLYAVQDPDVWTGPAPIKPEPRPRKVGWG